MILTRLLLASIIYKVIKMERKLIEMAKSALKNSYSPYSGFKVGAALLCRDGSIYTGANVECASYGSTVCAERAAIVKAVNDGKRELTAIAVVSNNINEPCFPCGICLQMMFEFSDDLKVIVTDEIEEFKVFNITELLPYGFK